MLAFADDAALARLVIAATAMQGMLKEATALQRWSCTCAL